jgi:glycosyltransferase involved in cell wall biosynthesis
MNTNLVSIIIPVFNLQDYLEKCLNSIINQTFSNLEIIIIDDGSTDSSQVIIEKYKKIDPRIILLQGDHNGTAAARKLGIQYAHGDYLTFVDGDDWLDEDSIETMVSQFSDTDCEIVVAQHRKVYIQEKIRYEYKDDYPFDTIDPQSFLDIINERRDFTLWAKMFKKHLFENILFHEGVPLGQDGLVLKQVIVKSTHIKAVNKIVYNYLYRLGSAMRKTSSLVSKLLFLKGNLNNLPFYKGSVYNKERDWLMLYLLDLGVYYLKMDKREKDLYMRIWNENIYANNIHIEFKKNNPTHQDLDFIINYPKLNSLVEMTPIYFNLLLKKIKN